MDRLAPPRVRDVRDVRDGVVVGCGVCTGMMGVLARSNKAEHSWHITHTCGVLGAGNALWDPEMGDWHQGAVLTCL